MAEHVLKTWPNAFDAVKSGAKRFEWRRDDRGFEVGDVLVLRKWNPQLNGVGGYVIELRGGGRGDLSCMSLEPVELRVRVTYILRGQFGVPADYCVMSIEPEQSNA